MQTDTQPLSTAERRRVIRDIVRHKLESEPGADDEYARYVIDDLSDRSDAALEDLWFATVGEWVVSRDDQYVYMEAAGPDAHLERQFEHVRAGEPTTYGFTEDVALPEAL